MKNACRKL